MDRFDPSPYLRGEVIDIKDPLCPPVDKILVDTNVLYFCYYPRSSQLAAFGQEPRYYQTREYPSFLKKLLSSGAELFVHEIALLEFTNLVKRAELKLLYSQEKNTSEIPPDLNFKNLCCAYPNEYFSIQGSIQTYLSSIKKRFKLLRQDISIEPLLADFSLKWRDSLADVGDAMMFAEAERQGIYCILSDDALIATIEDIILYTANETAIDAYKNKQSPYAQKNPTDVK